MHYFLAVFALLAGRDDRLALSAAARDDDAHAASPPFGNGGDRSGTGEDWMIDVVVCP